MKSKNSEDLHKSRSTSGLETRRARTQGKGMAAYETLQTQEPPTRERSKSTSPSKTQESSKPWHVNRGSANENKTIRDGYIGNTDLP